MKDIENISGRVAVLELGGEGVGKEIVLRTLFVGFQGIVEDELEIGRGGDCGDGARVRHKGGRSEEPRSCSGPQAERMRTRALPRVQESLGRGELSGQTRQISAKKWR